MSLVGPRPERQYYIDQIVKKAPYYLHLQKIKPGITSWGQVKYGYAENVDQMVERLKYDILYLENMTLMVDFKIIIYTLITVFREEGFNRSIVLSLLLADKLDRRNQQYFDIGICC